MFSSGVCEFIKKMGMPEIEYYDLISNQFGKNVTIFETMISFFMNKKNFKKSEFNDYVSNNKIDREADFFESLFEIFCCLELFISDGKLKLYKFRQPEWNVPCVILNKSDFDVELLEDIKGIKFIYRGLSKE